MQKAKTARNELSGVDEYIDKAPEEFQSKLSELRNAIRDAAPQAEEKISYQMPFYYYKGRVAYFGYAKDHIGLYAMPMSIEEHLDEVKTYRTGKSTLRFSFDKPLPITLVKNLVKAQIKINESKK
jgi:uncharacterized protein YdhG (YjbR/CyaY superfamily)